MTKRTINRRTVLRGLSGLTVSLPWLEISADSKKPIRPNTAFLFMPNGVHPHKWTPTGEGEDYTFSEILAPLNTLKNDFDVLTNLGHMKARKGDGHYAKTANFLSGALVAKTSGKNISSGISADQLIAQNQRNTTPLGSIELGVEPTRTSVDNNVGFTQIYGGHISWSSATTPVPKEIYPQLAFDRLFYSNRDKRLASILDDIKGDVKRMNNILGYEDKARMDEFYSSIRALEKQIQNSTAKTDVKHQEIPHEFRPDKGLPDDLKMHIKIMLDIIVLAFKMKRTDVATFMFGNAVSGKNFSFLPGVEGGFHQLSHHANNKQKMDMYAKINTFHIQMFAYFLSQLKKIKEGDNTILDNSLVMFGSGLRDGNRHDPKNLPILIAGKGGQNIQRGKHRVFNQDTPLCNLLLGILKSSNLEIDSFGDSNGIII